MNRIREKRDSKGIRQNWLAEKANISNSALCLYENSMRKPPRDVLQRIADVLGVEVNEIWDDAS